LFNDAAETEMAILQDLIVNIRNIRAELEVLPKDRVPVRIFAAPEVQESFEQNRTVIEKLANVDSIDFVRDSLAKAPSARSTARFDVAIVYEKKVDAAAERDRLKKELARLEAERTNAERQLSNDGFLRKAPTNVVDGVRSRKAELDGLVEKLRRALDELH
jgi:valyl-tRNA synthetase